GAKHPKTPSVVTWAVWTSFLFGGAMVALAAVALTFMLSAARAAAPFHDWPSRALALVLTLAIAGLARQRLSAARALRQADVVATRRALCWICWGDLALSLTLWLLTYGWWVFAAFLILSQAYTLCLRRAAEAIEAHARPDVSDSSI